MSNKTKETIYERALKKWPGPVQLIVLVEECAELIKAVNKLLRAGYTGGWTMEHVDDIAEEAADVLIMIEQLKVMTFFKGFNTPIPKTNELIERFRIEKLKRLEEILES